MKNFFKKVGKFLDVTRKVTVNIFTAIFVIYFVVIIAMLISGDEEVVTAGKVVILNPEGIFVEEERFDYSFESIFEEAPGQYAYRDRRVKKRTSRSLWIVRINAAARANGISYSALMNGLNKLNIDVDRKVLADLALNNPEAFASLAEQAKTAL